MEPDRPEKLLREAIAGDTPSLVELLMDQQPRLLRRIENKLPRSLARTISGEDVVQEVFRRAFQDFSAFIPLGDATESFSAWLGTIADNALRDALRRHRSGKRGGGCEPGVLPADRSSFDPLVDLMAMNTPAPSRSLSRVEMAAAMQKAINGLREEDQQCLTLRYLNGLPVADVAERIGRTETAAQKLCLRALDRLRDAYHRVVGNDSAG